MTETIKDLLRKFAEEVSFIRDRDGREEVVDRYARAIENAYRYHRTLTVSSTEKS